MWVICFWSSCSKDCILIIMGFRAVRSWSLSSLIKAFIELSIAYTLLCGSLFSFIPSKLLSALGLYFPCPCTGFFGYQNYDLCFHRLLIDWPITKIATIQELAKTRFPFDLIWFDHQSCNLHVERIGIRNCSNGVFVVEGDACSGSISGPICESSVDKEFESDLKGKRSLNQKQKPGVRRRRRAALGYGKNFPATSFTSTGTNLVGVGIPYHVYDGSVMRTEFSDCLDPGSAVEDGFVGDQNARNSSIFSQSTATNFEYDGSYWKGKDIDKDSATVEIEANVIRQLVQSLEEEKVARAALYQELEKERAAAATAADEAMAMILRLQEDKASIEMEARQYHRVIEEKFAYDDEEMKIFKEILIRREREIHFLEKEVEAYERMSFLGNEQAEGDSSYQINDEEQGSSPSVNSIDEKGMGSTAKRLLYNEQSQALGEEMISVDLISDLCVSQDLVQSTDSVAGKQETERDIRMISPKKSDTIEEELGKDEDHRNQLGCKIHSSILDSESTVYDVHVVDATTSVQSDKLLSDCSNMTMADIEPIVRESSFDMHNISLVSGNSSCKTVNFDSQRRSPSPIDGERLKIDNEVERLRERLRIVQEEKEKLTFSAEHREIVNTQLKLVEDVLNQLREIQQLREPTRHASLPTSSSKASLKKRHHRSPSYEGIESS
ncbi:uncharacterized protein LOC126656094 [Mercurialis annua]|uniref:uncharacterized protein LOC126656094 n=1 Tax=Mercurialis annua TaxID=3986 RepID=UPI00215E170B|nr:uncharacterized protein LOC126656094 [Mercurialis annua]